MKNKKYALGMDFGTLSVRVLLINLENGEETAVSVKEYPHGVMDVSLTCGKKLPADYALQHPSDYIECMISAIKEVLDISGINAEEIAGIGVDFTACTVIPVRNDGTPLCLEEKYKNEPHAYVKLWKHHSAAAYADKMAEIAESRKESFLKYYSGKISSEWLIPKIWEILDENEALYNDADKFTEAGDWITWMLTGKETRNACCAGYKATWNAADGYPSKDFLKALDPRLENLVADKLSEDIYPTGALAGYVTEKAAKLTGLAKGTPVAVCVIDAHAAFPASGITTPGKMLFIMGTSGCHLALSDTDKSYPGICGIVKDGFISGYYGYEAGQCCFGDHFDWVVMNCMTEEYIAEAKERGISKHKLLREKAQKQKPGEHGLLALDWWGGSRSDLMDSELSGLILGMTLTTKPEDIYRALIEANAYGSRVIVDMFAKADVKIDEIYAGGGIAKKDPFMMQIFADVLNMPIHIVESEQAGALGSAMFGAVAGGYFANLDEAAKIMVKPSEKTYLPIKENSDVYDVIFEEYVKLHDYFAAKDSVIKNMRKIKKQS